MCRSFQGEGDGDRGRDHDYGDGLLVYRSDGDEAADAEEGYSSSAISEEEVKYDPSVWQSVIRYGPEDRDLHPAARGCVYPGEGLRSIAVP